MKKVIIYLLLVISLFIFSSCKNSETLQTDVTTTPVPTKAATVQETIEEEIEYRTEQIFTKEDEGKLIFYFFDIHEIDGKYGDCVLICFPNDEIMLIDAGTRDSGKYIAERLEKFDIDKIDYAVVSHMHSDHFGGYYELFENIEIEAMYSPNLIYPPQFDGDKWEEALKAAKIEYLRYERGDIFDIGDVHIEVLNPEATEENNHSIEVLGEMGGVVNDLSGVMMFQYGKNTALFTADIYAVGEEKIVNLYGEKLEADLVKVPHHGYNTSSSKLFVNTVKPQITVATGGVVMPKEYYKRYKESGSDVYVTFIDGMVKVTMDGENQ